jgi:cytochrome c oxidase subunit 1
MNLAFFPMHFVGMLGMPRRVYTYSSNMGFDQMNLWSTVGALLIAPAILVFMWNVLKSARSGAVAGNDPWGGSSLEWAIPSPPPVYNFASLPEVQSVDPLWHKGAREAALACNTVTGPIHMPSNSHWPMVSALGVTLTVAGIIFGFWVGIPGLLLTLIGIYSWSFQPADH